MNQDRIISHRESNQTNKDYLTPERDFIFKKTVKVKFYSKFRFNHKSMSFHDILN